jgi:hypothetical protein
MEVSLALRTSENPREGEVRGNLPLLILRGQAQVGAVVATDSVSVDAVATTALRFRRCLDAEGVRDVQIAA